MRKSNLLLIVLLLLTIITLLSGQPSIAQDQNKELPKKKEASKKEITRWIGQLNSDNYQLRKTATEQLKNTNGQVIEPLLESWGKGDLEYDTRAVIIIQHLMWHVDMPHGDQIETTLDRLAKSSDERLADLSKRLILQFQTQREPMAIDAIRKYHGQIEIRIISSPSLQTKSVILDKAWTGGNEKVHYLRMIKNLTALNIHSPEITSKGFRTLADLNRLITLNLDDSKVTDADLKQISNLTTITEIRLKNTSITGIGLQHLSKLTNMENLYLAGTKITDNDLAFLKTMKNLRGLELDNTNITDESLIHLAQIKNLKWLSLDKTAVSDGGMKHLRSLKYLRRLFVKHSKVTKAGEKTLNRILPRVTMIR